MMLRDFFLFRRMLTPVFIQIIFWIGVIATLTSGIINMVHKDWFSGLQLFFLGPIFVRVFCELLILFFRMNETLTDIKNTLHEHHK